LSIVKNCKIETLEGYLITSILLGI